MDLLLCNGYLLIKCASGGFYCTSSKQCLCTGHVYRVVQKKIYNLVKEVFVQPVLKTKFGEVNVILMRNHLHLVPRLMRGSIPPLLEYVFMAWRLVKHKDNFTFALTLITTKF
jgi:hypothetical protein